MAKKMNHKPMIGKRMGDHESMNSKFLPSQRKIDGAGESGKLFLKGKDKGHAAAFDMPSHGVQFGTQMQADYKTGSKVDKRGAVEHEKH